jgi:isoquinoline 1-oxidoreductase subunit alpha
MILQADAGDASPFTPPNEPSIPVARPIRAVSGTVPTTHSQYDMPITFTINDQRVEFSGDETMPLLWYLRDHAQLPGTRFGCGIGVCGACTVHLDGTAARSCVLPLSAVASRRVTTIEGLGGPGLHAVQQAWLEEDVPQCGWCQAGQLMAAADLLRRTPDPSEAQLRSLTNLCRCGTYPRVRRAIRRAAALLKADDR